MGIVLCVLYTLIFCFLLLYVPAFKLNGIKSRTLVFAFLLKIAFGTAMFFIYTYYPRYQDSGGDILKFFNDAKIMFSALDSNIGDFFKMLFGINDKNNAIDSTYYANMSCWHRKYESNLYNNNHIMIRYNAVLLFLSRGFYHSHTVITAFLSTLGLLYLYKFVQKRITDKPKLLFVAIFLLPSTLFWASGVLKESLIIFTSGILVYFCYIIFVEKRAYIYAIPLVLITAFFILYLKIYIAICYFPLIAIFVIIENTDKKNIALKYLLGFTSFVILGLLLKYIHPELDAVSLIATKQKDFIGLSLFNNSGSYIDNIVLKPNIWSILANAPIGFINVFFRPFIFESYSLFMLLAAIENTILISALIIAIIFRKKEITNKNLFYFSIFYVILSFTLIGITTPVMGAFVRYKVPSLQFLAIISVIIVDKDSLLSFVQKIFKRKNKIYEK